MSVIIYGTDENSRAFCGLTVSSEHSFHTVWEPVIDLLNLKYIGDQRYLYKKDLPAILSEFRALYNYSKGREALYDIELHTKEIIDDLEKKWNENVPNAERLWMG